MAQPRTRAKIVDALLALMAERSFDRITLEDLAARSGVSLAALRGAFEGRLAVLAEFVRGIDEKVLAGIDVEMRGEAPRERLFDILFSRFEALAPHKPAIRNLGRAARRDPLLALALNRMVVNSMAWMLAAAGIPATGSTGALRAQGLALVWARVMRVWLDDEDAGQARTMAELDRRLREAERTFLRLRRLANIGRGRRRRPAAETAGSEPDVAEGHPS